MLVVVACAACDCDEGAPVPGAERVNDLVPEPDEGDPEAPAPPVLQMPEPDPEPIRFVLPESGDLPELETVRTHTVRMRGSIWHEVRLSNPVARRRLDALLEVLAYAHGGIVDDEDDVGCRAVLATERVVSMLCVPLEPGREGYGYPGDAVAAHFAIDGEVVRPFDASTAFVPGTTPLGIVGQRGCVRRLERAADLDRDVARNYCQDYLEEARFVLVRRGALVPFRDNAFLIPWEELREHLRDTGPLAWLFAGMNRPPSPSAEDADGWAIGETLPMTELGVQWATLPEGLMGQVQVATRGLGAGQLVVPGTDALATAREVAGALGQPLRRAAWEGEPLQLRRVRAADTVSLLSMPKTEPDTTIPAVRWVPGGTHFVTVSPTHESEAPVPNHVRVAAALRMVGWVRETSLVADEGCVPSGDAFLASLPEEGRAGAAERLTIASSRLHSGGSTRPVVIFATRVEAESHVAIHERGEHCAVGEEVLRVSHAGYFFDVHLTTTEPDGGESLLVIGFLRGRAGRRFVVRQVSDGRRVGSFDPVDPDAEHYVRGQHADYPPETGPVREGEGYWPFSTSWPRGWHTQRYRWDGQRLALDEPP